MAGQFFDRFQLAVEGPVGADVPEADVPEADVPEEEQKKGWFKRLIG